MSYGKEIKFNAKEYLVELTSGSSLHVYVAEKTSNDEYSMIFDDDFTDSYKEEAKLIEKIYDEDEEFYAILHTVLDSKNITNPYEEYSSYIKIMMKQMSTTEILNSDSDEKIIYNINYPLDYMLDDFERITKSIIENSKEN
ncbi:hypothetical protein [Poseidonibacter ostreae]|uniref:Uncharacterized protein n=1 Tax=Poseidonibacter ostreae TaxID=2654171 RepID=A0A6L4WSL0_9BACT|nr:hypothetical protein [Poseidonibacter ostreae]KAB7884994.1 hypothetical protein GA417_09715 [Poseidonibacter ostreae]KAB7888986.1 hypothetical protein GBG19_07295 [Poseidonibacter ostreae]KAB7891919.1 hypothetical protein GBG18_04845 [Poseidonibacter ostreae]MAC84342.1 hypothetical protein [Arcobacter sp.]|tara:strand:- start:38716 stop:39138 length:423 start_codon:yes stop_codon:yes gene_type:complete